MKNKNKDEILFKWWNKQNQEGLSTNDCIINAMQEWAEEYHRQHIANPLAIKSVCPNCKCEMCDYDEGKTFNN